MSTPVNFDSSEEVKAFVISAFKRCYQEADGAWIGRVFDDIEGYFAGKNPLYRLNDLKYHNLRHTLMVAACMAELLEGYHGSRNNRGLRSRDFELGIAAVLLHDSGYLMLRSDETGTGAKYTFCHIIRSCAFAASYLPALGASSDEIEDVIGAINCTGATAEIGRVSFRQPSGRTLGAALATADYVAQMADPLYPDKLGELYAELHESDEYARVPSDKRAFHSEQELIRMTPDFWRNFVKPKLEREFGSAYRMLERPIGSGRNAYLDAIDRNMHVIETRLKHMGSP